MTSSLEFYLPRVNAPKLSITSVCDFLSSWCMAWMLSIKYFVLFTQILWFSLNWRTHLQNGVFFGIYITSGQCYYGLYYIRLCFFRFFVYGLNVIDQILCLFCWNYKNFSKLTNTSPKWRHLWNFIWVRSMPLRFVLHPFVFLWVLCVWLECYRLNTLSFLLKF